MEHIVVDFSCTDYVKIAKKYEKNKDYDNMKKYLEMASNKNT